MALTNLFAQQQQPQGGIDQLAQNAMYPQSQMDKTQYAVPSQMPTSSEVINSDYDPQTNPYTGMPDKPFKKGGIASIPRYNGEEDGSQVQSWDPASGQVNLVKTDTTNINQDTGQPTTSNVAYTIPKDNIKTFIPNPADESGMAGGGQYILNDGSTITVGSDGTVQTATPSRNDYTLNSQGYYQPTGSSLTWNGDTSTLTKNIGGVDVPVPGQYTKGGYQDAQGNLRTDANGTPIPLAPAQFDSGAGQSGLGDAMPYITAAAMAAMTMGASLPESAATLGAENVAGADIFGGLAGTGGSYAGMTPAEQAAAAAAAAGGTGTTAAGTGSLLGDASLQELSQQTADAAAQEAAQTAPYNTATVPSGMTAAQKALLVKEGLSALNSGISATNTPTSSGGIASAPAATTTPTVNQFGVTGYTGETPTGQTSLYTPTLSRIKGSTGEQAFAQGGIATLGAYSDGGQLLKGPGDGMSDNIPAKIGQHQPARLADGEFVVPADVVSHLGNGSTDAGAKQLYAMMDRIRKARTGNKKQGKQINPSKFLPQG